MRRPPRPHRRPHGWRQGAGCSALPFGVGQERLDEHFAKRGLEAPGGKTIAPARGAPSGRTFDPRHPAWPRRSPEHSARRPAGRLCRARSSHRRRRGPGRSPGGRRRAIRSAQSQNPLPPAARAPGPRDRPPSAVRSTARRETRRSAPQSRAAGPRPVRCPRFSAGRPPGPRLRIAISTRLYGTSAETTRNDPSVRPAPGVKNEVSTGAWTTVARRL